MHERKPLHKLRQKNGRIGPFSLHWYLLSELWKICNRYYINVRCVIPFFLIHRRSVIIIIIPLSFLLVPTYLQTGAARPIIQPCRMSCTSRNLIPLQQACKTLIVRGRSARQACLGKGWSWEGRCTLLITEPMSAQWHDKLDTADLPHMFRRTINRCKCTYIYIYFVLYVSK